MAKPLHWRINLDSAAALLDIPTTTSAIHPDQVQAVIGGSGTLTNKLRALANIPWRHSRGHKKHMRNSDIRSALAPFVASELLAQLS